MKILPKILFLYSAVASFFIAVSLTLTSNSLVPVVFALLFLPVAGYFVTELFKELKRENNTPLSIKKGEAVTIFVLFLILLGFSIKNISSSKKENDNFVPEPTPNSSSSPLIFKSNATPSPTPDSTLTIDITDGSETVNIREKPTVYSKLLQTAKNGEGFKYVKKDNGWYQIELATGGTGYISIKYAKEDVR